MTAVAVHILRAQQKATGGVLFRTLGAQGFVIIDGRSENRAFPAIDAAKADEFHD